MPGVNFTRESADRIADTVRRSERQASPDNKLQRRRAGGLGRSTLWEVTAVQTGPGTVTIKRVSNIAFDLNDLSEKTDILYDPDNEPSVGDRGLLIRLGQGTLFFFRRVGASSAVTYLSESALVKSDAPNTNFNHNVTPLTLYEDHNGVKHDIVYEFATPITAAEFLNTRSLFKIGHITGIGTPYSGTPGSQSVTILIDVYTIKEAFDASAITWNSLAGLSTKKITGSNFNSSSFGVSFLGSATLLRPTQFGDVATPGLTSDAWPMYGIYLEFSTTSNHTSWTTQLPLVNSVGDTYPGVWIMQVDPTILL